LVKFEDVNQREVSEKLAKKEVFTTQENLDNWVIEEEEYDSFSYLVGFDLFNQNQELLGKIEDVLELPQHELAQLNINGKEVLIPLDENLIIEIDEEKHAIHIHIVDGLLDIYL
jgi:16S rRNA processing protein RimM